MRHTLKIAKTMMPVALSTLVLVSAAPQVAIAAQDTQPAPVTNVLNGEDRDNNQSLPPVRTSLTKEEAEQMAGCEVYIDEANREYVIRPKNGANEGIISDSSNIWTEDFKRMRKKLSGQDNPNTILKRDWPIRFDKRIYFYMHVKGDYDYSPLFMSIQPDTINMGDNVSIKFIKDMENFFAQAHILDGLHHINGIEKWDTAHVTIMKNMFSDAHQLEGKLDLSRWNVSKNWHFDNMFSFVGNDNDSFVLNFSNKKFMNQTHVDYMFSSFHGVLIANNWTVEDSNAPKNPIRELMDGQNFLLTYKKDNEWIDKSAHLLITDNPIILEKNKTKQYKYYKKVKVIYKTKDKEQQVELELPAVYDSRIDDNGKLDASKPACSDPMKVVKPQIDEAIINAVKEMRTKNPALNLPENVIPVPVHEVKDTDSPTALFQTYYLATVKEEVTKAKTTYTADPNLEYKKVEYDPNPQDGKKQVITGAIKNGAWDPDATSEKEITKAVDGKARVGNKKVENEEIQPGVTYEADSSLTYKQEQTTEGTKGTKTTTTIYKVNPDTGLTAEVDSTSTVDTVKAKDKVIKVGNVEKKTGNIPFKKTYEGNPDLTYQKQETKTVGQNGKEEVALTYKVDAKTGLTSEVEAKKGLCTQPVNEVIQVGNKEVKSEEIQPGVTYQADSSLAYNTTNEIAGIKGTKTTTTIYKVDENTGLTNTVQSSESKTTTAAIDKVIKVGNVKTETTDIDFKTTYEDDNTLDEGVEETKTEGKKGSRTVITTYEVDKTNGLTTKAAKTDTQEVQPTNKVVRRGTKKKTPQPPTPSPLPAPTPAPAQPAQTLAPEHPLAKTHAPKHMRADVLPKTGETSLLGTLLAALGLSITGLGVLYKKKTPRKGKHLSE